MEVFDERGKKSKSRQYICKTFLCMHDGGASAFSSMDLPDNICTRGSVCSSLNIIFGGKREGAIAIIAESRRYFITGIFIFKSRRLFPPLLDITKLHYSFHLTYKFLNYSDFDIYLSIDLAIFLRFLSDSVIHLISRWFSVAWVNIWLDAFAAESI